ncbi:TetR/AcrR family transcriptional regulator [Paraburkholderia phenoliruptrix]|uniref:TetR/AcrR family transcriptional regulator n=1 Tax=Paraburkholderia phenoliruptrix TaxID=252970 RepID=UPI001C6F36C7|nr:TetR/AcrR family transcriptional regulator [Paraburkholderia phenoliruptrix]MBW9107418.1 TetR/AcrR family transcriptional regulator [Paraburkholderia phenoliruptrix]MBW9128160.1 TetR/AcrR family transcriptional regulator [Paraburkholderia ginsengiterrae]
MKDLKITSEEIRGVSPSHEPKRRGNRRTRIPEILEAAIRVFADEGYVGFTQRRIASDAGIRLSTLQHYFGTREELLKSAIAEMARRHIGSYREMAKDNTRSPDERFERIIDHIFDLLTGPERYAGAFILHCWSLAEHEPFVQKVMADDQAELIDIFAGLIAKLNPLLVSGECVLRAGLIVSHLFGLLVFIRRCGDDTLDWRSFQVASKAVWKALSKAPQ